ncbi:uncharacterized protein LOC106467034 [Limulus polyphemus]|uniref:Uncharacterized protein LOC106467034 n=1 Tax=Limulus polyphemus TaxID=6850 RepID=A0ABM1T4N9_LIMPO|nr:uncharacterized protein LOC106467034 [Limulus polyphemus]XP_022250845.1 uncharacterized protein LOC106467034 [Limulus polyphemus]XP_022250846.1 uncharacterized protein LOC106467034 [Limulus polyphemus]XP_022250847.1 uncharacterized protein LOC106467034 [Limulus polyphemus]
MASAVSMTTAQKIELMNKKFLEFWIDKVRKYGSISLQNLTGHASQLSPELRNFFGTSKSALKKFLWDNSDYFYIDNKENVWPAVQVKLEHTEQPKFHASETKSSSNKTDDKNDITELRGVKGKIIRLFPVYGFISIVEPIQVSVYFDLMSFEDGSKETLPSYNLSPGEGVYLNAKKGPDGCEAHFRASRVWRPSYNPGSKNKPKEMFGKLDNLNEIKDITLETEDHVIGRGKVQNIFDRFGFIQRDQNLQNNVFFHISDIEKPAGVQFEKLEEVIQIGEEVLFSATRSYQKDSLAKWQATYVLIKHFSKDVLNSEIEQEEVFISGSEMSSDSDLEDCTNSIHKNLSIKDPQLEDISLNDTEIELSKAQSLTTEQELAETQSLTAEIELAEAQSLTFFEKGKVKPTLSRRNSDHSIGSISNLVPNNAALRESNCLLTSNLKPTNSQWKKEKIEKIYPILGASENRIESVHTVSNPSESVSGLKKSIVNPNLLQPEVARTQVNQLNPRNPTLEMESFLVNGATEKPLLGFGIGSGSTLIPPRHPVGNGLSGLVGTQLPFSPMSGIARNSAYSSDLIPPDLFRDNVLPRLPIGISPLTKDQLKEALVYMLMNDDEFLSKIHEAYISSLTKKLNQLTELGQKQNSAR